MDMGELMDMITDTTMSIDAQRALYTLQTWFSPSFPIGAYTYSHGLENAFETGLVRGLDDAVDWIGDIMLYGNGFADSVFLNEAHRAVRKEELNRLAYIAEYATAFCGTQELRLESEAQGAAFVETVQNVGNNFGLERLSELWSGPYPYSVAVGAAASALGIEANATITAYLHGFVSNLSSALVRIIPLGQTDGQRIIMRLEPVVENAAVNALETSLENLSVSTLTVDLTSMKHEIQYTRLFRS